MDDKKSASTKLDEVMGCSFDNASTGMKECDEMLELDDLQTARAHWIQLFKTNMQVAKISSFDTNNDNWQNALSPQYACLYTTSPSVHPPVQASANNKMSNHQLRYETVRLYNRRSKFRTSEIQNDLK